MDALESVAGNRLLQRGEPFRILFIEDNEAHAELVLRSFEDQTVANQITHFSNGEAALDYLFRRGQYSRPEKSPRPHVILLDLRLPRIDGFDILRQVKTNDQLKTIPVVILTTSAAERDIALAYTYQANSYVVKPLEFPQFSQLMEDFGLYWLGWNQYSFGVG